MGARSAFVQFLLLCHLCEKGADVIVAEDFLIASHVSDQFGLPKEANHSSLICAFDPVCFLPFVGSRLTGCDG